MSYQQIAASGIVSAISGLAGCREGIYSTDNEPNIGSCRCYFASYK
jgi:hypothetical protein